MGKVWEFLEELFSLPEGEVPDQKRSTDDMKVEVKTISKPSRSPTILISHEAFRDIKFILESCPDHEIGWLGTVSKIDDDEYLIERIFIFEQEAGPGHCDLDPKEIAKFVDNITERGKKNREISEKLLFWGHLHPGNLSEASPQDELQMSAFSDNPYFIRGIFTRHGKWSFSFFDYENNLRHHGCTWKLSFYDPKRKEEIKKLIKEKVKVK